MKQSLERVLTDPCPYCSGSGVIKSSSTICYEILDQVRKLGEEIDGPGLVLRVNPEIARVAEGRGSRRAEGAAEHAAGRPSQLKPDALLHHEQFDVMAL